MRPSQYLENIEFLNQMSGDRKFDKLSEQNQLALIALSKKGNRLARDKLINSYIPFIVALADKACKNHLFFQDCFQEAYLGAIHAIDYYDVNSGIKFLSYAVWWMRAYVSKYISKNLLGLPFTIPADHATRMLSGNRGVEYHQAISGDYVKTRKGARNSENYTLNLRAVSSASKESSSKEELSIFDTIGQPDENTDELISNLDFRALINELPDEDIKFLSQYMHYSELVRAHEGNMDDFAHVLNLKSRGSIAHKFSKVKKKLSKSPILAELK